MDTSSGEVFKDLDTALKSGAKKEDVIEFDEMTMESNKLLMGTLKFLLKDNAFDTDFLLTTIIDYICNEAKNS